MPKSMKPLGPGVPSSQDNRAILANGVCKLSIQTHVVGIICEGDDHVSYQGVYLSFGEN